MVVDAVRLNVVVLGNDVSIVPFLNILVRNHMAVTASVEFSGGFTSLIEGNRKGFSVSTVIYNPSEDNCNS
jgi:hypothetical protein